MANFGTAGIRQSSEWPIEVGLTSAVGISAVPELDKALSAEITSLSKYVSYRPYKINRMLFTPVLLRVLHQNNLFMDKNHCIHV
jgi:hypothetical protein